MPGRPKHLILRTLSLLVIVFTIIPVATVLVFSFNSSRFYAFPITGLTSKWYLDLFRDSRVAESLLISVFIALAVTLLATVLGTAFAFFVARTQSRYKLPAAASGLLPLVFPTLVVAAGLQVAFVSLALPLGYATVIIGHTIYATPFVALMVLAQLTRYDRRLDAAARDLGAGPFQALSRVTLPILWPSIRSAAILAFLLSFNEWAIAFFNGRGFNTLPMLIYSMQRNGLPPTILAYSALTIFIVIAMSCIILPFALKTIRQEPRDE